MAHEHKDHVQAIIGVVVILAVGLGVSPIVGTFASQAAGNATAAGNASAALFYNLVPFFYALLIIVAVVGIMYKMW